jgi:hypothetical protein
MSADPNNTLTIFREIVEGEKLVLEQHLSDEDANEHDSVEWPASMITLCLEDEGEKTRLTVLHTGMASPRATLDDYRQGWSESLDRLEGSLTRG